MIISASYKTDIPAFYGDWFRNRRMAGSCEVRNAWNGKTFRVSLRDADCSGFVFWTRNARPFAAELERTSHTHPFIVQYTVTGYPRVLERSVVSAETAITDVRRIVERYGNRSTVWRYDPVIITDATPTAWHVGNFERLAGSLAGSVDEVVVSFAQIYRKTHRSLDRAQAKTGNAWRDPDDETKRALLARLEEIAGGAGLSLTLCTQPDLVGGQLSPARCIDADRLNAVARDLGHAPVAARTKGARPGCLCAKSRDIGGYDTCPHGCVYCYAVTDHNRARKSHRSHDGGSTRLGDTFKPETIDA